MSKSFGEKSSFRHFFQKKATIEAFDGRSEGHRTPATLQRGGRRLSRLGLRSLVTRSPLHAAQVDPFQKQRQFFRTNLTATRIWARRPWLQIRWELIAPFFQPLEAGFTIHPFLVHYRIYFERDGQVWPFFHLHRYRFERFLGTIRSGLWAAVHEFFSFASCRNRESSSLSAHTIQCLPDGVRREWTQSCFAQ